MSDQAEVADLVALLRSDEFCDLDIEAKAAELIGTQAKRIKELEEIVAPAKAVMRAHARVMEADKKRIEELEAEIERLDVLVLEGPLLNDLERGEIENERLSKRIAELEKELELCDGEVAELSSQIGELEATLMATPGKVWRALHAWSDDDVDNDESSEYSRIEAALLAAGFQKPQ